VSNIEIKNTVTIRRREDNKPWVWFGKWSRCAEWHVKRWYHHGTLSIWVRNHSGHVLVSIGAPAVLDTIDNLDAAVFDSEGRDKGWFCHFSSTNL